MMMVMLGGTLFQASQCNPAVRDAILSGLQSTTVSAANILIQAMFAGLSDDQNGTTNTAASTGSGLDLTSLSNLLGSSP